jgi:hypothetical protein
MQFVLWSSVFINNAVEFFYRELKRKQEAEIEDLPMVSNMRNEVDGALIEVFQEPN